MPKRKGNLTDLEKKFTEEYPKDLDCEAAAKRAGYSEKNAKIIGYQLKNKPNVAAEIQKNFDKRSESSGITAEKILKRLDEIGDIDIGDAYDDTGRLLNIKDMPVHVRKAISSIKVFEEFEGHGQERIKVGEVREVRFNDKLKANELLGRHLKLFQDKLEVSFSEGLADKIARARKRATESK